MGGTGTAVVERACFHCLRVAVFFLLADELRRPLSPTPALRPVATKVRKSSPLPSVDARPSSRGRTRRSHYAAAPPPLVMPAIEPGWDDFLQVPPPSPTRVRRLPTLPSPSGRHVPPPSWPSSWPDAGAFAFTCAPVQSRRPCADVHPSTRAP
jgi:hypothetical protein